jgi:hypothetical protein
MMNDFEKIEHLLLNKKFEELNPTEMREVQGYFENATDYNDMRETLMQVKSTLAADKLLIKPNVDLKEKLLQQFENTYSNVTPKAAGKTRPFYRKMAFQWSAAASIVVILTLSAVTYVNNMNSHSKEMAINYDKPQKQDAPLEEKSMPNGTLTADSTSVTNSNPERKENLGDQPVVGSTTTFGSNSDEAEKDKGTILSNKSTNENKILEGELKNTENNPTDLLSKDADDNTTIDTRERSKTEEKRDDANYYYNGALKDKEDKKQEINNIPVNTTVNEVKSNTTKDYYTRKKQKNTDQNQGDKIAVQKENTDNINLGGYMSVNQMVQTEKKDSNKVKLDSLNMDSNKINNQRRESSIEINAPKKDN